MKFLKGLLFVFGVMLLGVSLKLKCKQGGDSSFGAFFVTDSLQARC